ncbi:hypothetical protein N018_15190 [Pseudomonas syringae CC1557]|uniref:Lipoprotein n=1 Tax=Pseudomonas syringae CC1557 TaxID=1357279 RepID=W0MXB9_PSESX|nr:hypothetical protein [Pseudomonas syringae]AHG41461.1 hypothetical protein N018_15190 [Pseudomonas syringae CC1557]
MKTSIYAVLLSGSLLVVAGCDQIESSTKRALDSAAEAAKQTIEETHQAANNALDEARQELSILEAPPNKAETESKSHKEI